MSQDHSLTPALDPDKTRPANFSDSEPTLKAISPVNPGVNQSADNKLPGYPPARAEIDDDATLVVELGDDEFTQVVAQSGVKRAPGHAAVTTQDLTLQAKAMLPDSASQSLSMSSSSSQTTYGSFASRGHSQLRKLAQEAAAMQAAPVPHYDGPSSSTSLPPGFGLFEYRIDKVLGQGSFGITYLATDVNLNVRVAIKEYLPSHCASRAGDYSVVVRWPEAEAFYLDGLEAFLMEARTLATFQHPNIVGVARFFEAYRTAYIVLDYEEGQSLKQWWSASRQPSETWLVELLQPLLDGLALVHESGYLHRDIKPDNIYASIDDGRLVLLDFGAARSSVGGEQAVADVLTPGYAPAEQYEGGSQGPWTDIYAFGATLYWMVTGKKPEPAPARLAGEVMMVPAVEAGAGRYGVPFLEAIDWALQPKSQARPQSVRQFCAALFAGHAGTLDLQDALRSAHESRNQAAHKHLTLARRAGHLMGALLHPSGWRLTVKMTLLMMVAALVPMLVTSYYNLQGSSANVSANELINLENLAHSTAGRVSQMVVGSRTFAAYLASDARFIDYLNDPTSAKGEALQARLSNLVDTNTDVQLAFLMDRNGNAPLSSDPDVTGKNFGFRQYFKAAMSGKSFTSGLVLGTTAGKTGLYFSNPVRDDNGTIIGVVVLRLKGASINAILDEVRQRDATLIPMMFDADGVLVAYPDESKLYSSLRELPQDTVALFVADQRFKRSRFENLNMPDLASALIGATAPGSLGFHSTLSGVDEFAGYAPVKGSELVVAVSESKRVFEAPLQKLFQNVLYSVIAVGLFFLVMAVGLARSIVRPVRRLTVAAEALKSGDFDNAKIKTRSHHHIDEIGQLARTFNIMIDVLRQRERQREQSGSRRSSKMRKDKG